MKSKPPKMTVERARKLLAMIDWDAHKARVEAELAKTVEAHKLAATKARAHARYQVPL